MQKLLSVTRSETRPNAEKLVSLSGIFVMPCFFRSIARFPVNDHRFFSSIRTQHREEVTSKGNAPVCRPHPLT